jgi:hypothetical protein
MRTYPGASGGGLRVASLLLVICGITSIGNGDESDIVFMILIMLNYSNFDLWMFAKIPLFIFIFFISV